MLSDMRGQRPKILIIDDDPTMGDTLRRYLAHWLDRYDFEFILNNPAHAEHVEPWEYICHQNPLLACVISDVAMPGMRGDQICSATRRHFPTVTVVLMSDDFRTNRPSIDVLADELKPHAMLEKHLLLDWVQIERHLLPLLTRALLPAGQTA